MRAQETNRREQAFYSDMYCSALQKGGRRTVLSLFLQKEDQN